MAGIVVGVDGSEGASQALLWACREAEVRGWPITAVMAWGFLDQHHANLEESFDPHYTEVDALAALDAYIEQSLPPERSGKVRRHIVVDLAAAALLDASADADLLVVGARGLGGFRSLLLGSVSQQCLHHASCPVAVVRNDRAALEDGHVERIVVGVDGSEPSRQALAWAVEEGRLRHSHLTIVHAWHVPYFDGFPYTTGAFDPASFEDTARVTLDATIAGVDFTGLSEPVERVLATGGAAPGLLEAAKGADLVVVGARGRGGFGELLLGSVSQQVTHHATCPVVVVHSSSEGSP